MSPSLLIHADPGCRSGFVSAWLSNSLTKPVFDVGDELKHWSFYKIHHLTDVNILKNFNGTKIRITPELEQIDLITLLFLRKNVYPQIPEFTRNEYSLETFTKLTEFSAEIFQWDAELDYSLYDYAINFSDTFDINCMVDLYYKINNVQPTEQMINVMIETNKQNQLVIDNKNHACSILKMVMLKEKELGLREDHRFWSVVDIYNSTPVDKLYNTIESAIIPENYGILLK